MCMCDTQGAVGFESRGTSTAVVKKGALAHRVISDVSLAHVCAGSVRGGG